MKTIIRNPLMTLCIIYSIGTNAQNWLDPSFGSDGVVSTSLASSFDGATCMALQPDGRIVVGGVFAPDANGADFMVARFEADGSLDTDFGNGGWNTMDVATFDVVNDLALQPDGRIVLVGTAQGTGADKVVMRFTASGQLDATFNGTGSRVIDGSYQEDQLNGVALQSDGRIVAVGQGFDGSKDTFYICRLNIDGTFDTSFGGTGEVEHTVSGDNCRANDVAVLPNGRIVSVGASYTGGTTGFDAVAVRYLADGTLDTGFDGDGTATMVWSFLDDAALAVLVQPDGKVLVGGAESQEGPDTRFVVSRLEADGGHDFGFGNNGTMRTWTGIATTRCGALALDGQGRILLAGAAMASGVARRSYVCRLSGADGALDPDFGSGGELFHPMIGPNEETPAVASQPDGKIVVAGTGGAGINYDVRMIRYLETPLTGMHDATASMPIRLLGVDPSGADVVITASGPFACRILDMNGRVVASPMIQGTTTGVRHVGFGTTLSSGAYSFVAITNGHTCSARFIVIP